MDLLNYLFEKLELLGRLSCWHLLLLKCNITSVTQNLMKGQAIVDHLAKNLVEEYQHMTDLLLEESIMNI